MVRTGRRGVDSLDVDEVRRDLVGTVDRGRGEKLVR